MEDILASIRRVIAEDPRAVSPRPGFPANRAEGVDGDDARIDMPVDGLAQEDDVLELDATLVHVPPEPEPSLVSPDAAEATRSSLAALTALRPQAAAVSDSGGALESVVRDMLRPLLKEWLDQRLPEIVEELVAREVARITGKG